jgi:hypothetical protein
MKKQGPVGRDGDGNPRTYFFRTRPLTPNRHMSERQRYKEIERKTRYRPSVPQLSHTTDRKLALMRFKLVSGGKATATCGGHAFDVFPPPCPPARG